MSGKSFFLERRPGAKDSHRDQPLLRESAAHAYHRDLYPRGRGGLPERLSEKEGYLAVASVSRRRGVRSGTHLARRKQWVSGFFEPFSFGAFGLLGKPPHSQRSSSGEAEGSASEAADVGVGRLGLSTGPSAAAEGAFPEALDDLRRSHLGYRITMRAKYVHTNLIAKDWRRLADFYQKVFGCVPVPPERNFSGKELEAGTGIPGARLQGRHLRLPGYDKDGPTLEIFQYSPEAERLPTGVNRPGYGHIAFSVENVEAARREVLQSGGRAVGEIVTLEVFGGAKVTWCYVTDPEGNVIELQSWSR